MIADTSPINYLVLIEEVEVLPRLYGRIVIPQAVLDAGESAAIALAVAHSGAVLLMDDVKGRNEAHRRQIPTIVPWTSYVMRRLLTGWI